LAIVKATSASAAHTTSKPRFFETIAVQVTPVVVGIDDDQQ